MKRVWQLALVAAVLAATSGCGDSAREGDELYLGECCSTTCVPAPSVGDSAVFGTDISNRGTEPVTIADVSLVEPNALALVAAFVFEIREGEEGIGALHLSGSELPLPAGWERRQDATGATVHSGQDLHLALVIDIDTEETGWARTIRIAYEDSKGRPYWQEAFTAIIVTHRTCDEAGRQYEEQMPGS